MGWDDEARRSPGDDLGWLDPELDRYRVATLAHDLRGSLGVILGVLSELEDETIEPGERAALRNIARRSGREAVRLVNAFLGAGQELSALEPVDVRRLVLGVVDAMRHHDQAGRVRLEVRAAPARRVPGDADGLRRLVANLIGNAMRHAGSRVWVTVEDVGDATVIVVEDDGDGIAPALRDNLFQAGASGRTGGTGLGLAIVRRIAEAHGGSVVARHRLPSGARFEVTLPASRPALTG